MSRLIDADKLKDAVYESFVPYQMEWARTIHQIQKVIDEQPPVEAVPVVHGEWINTDGYDEWTCSECFQEENCDDYPTEYGINFCSRCGADMRKKVKHE